MKRVSSDAEKPRKPRRAKKQRSVSAPPVITERSPVKHVSSHAAASPAKRTKRKGGAHCAK